MLRYLTIAPIIGMVYPIARNIVIAREIEKNIKGLTIIFFFLKKMNIKNRIS